MRLAAQPSRREPASDAPSPLGLCPAVVVGIIIITHNKGEAAGSVVRADGFGQAAEPGRGGGGGAAGGVRRTAAGHRSEAPAGSGRGVARRPRGRLLGAGAVSGGGGGGRTMAENAGAGETAAA